PYDVDDGRQLVLADSALTSIERSAAKAHLHEVAHVRASCERKAPTRSRSAASTRAWATTTPSRRRNGTAPVGGNLSWVRFPPSPFFPCKWALCVFGVQSTAEVHRGSRL